MTLDGHGYLRLGLNWYDYKFVIGQFCSRLIWARPFFEKLMPLFKQYSHFPQLKVTVFLLGDRKKRRLKMFNIFKKRFGREESKCWRRPCPDEVIMTSEISSGLGRRVACPNTDQCVIFVRKNKSAMADTADEHEEIASNQETHSKQTVEQGDRQWGRQKVTLEELKSTSPPGYKRFEAAIGSQDLDEETALLLWEDIFKPLCSFELLKIGIKN